MSAPCPRLGFRVHLDLAPIANSRDADATTRAFTDHLTSLGLTATVGRTDRMLTATVWRDGAQATQHDRDAIRAWTEQCAAFSRVELGDIVDLSDDD